MAAAVLALLSSLSWGLSDFLGGFQSRRVALLAVLVLSQGLAWIILAVAVLAGAPTEHDTLGLLYDYDFDKNTVRVDCSEFDVSAEGSTDDDVAEAIATAAPGDKLAGWPAWIQGVEYPSCPKCEQQMRLVFQLDSDDHLPFMFGDVGTGHITQCPEHLEVVAFGWACS